MIRDDRGLIGGDAAHWRLSLAQSRGALTYYYENQDKLDEPVRRGLEDSGKLTARFSGLGIPA